MLWPVRMWEKPWRVFLKPCGFHPSLWYNLFPQPCMFLITHQVNKVRLLGWMMRNVEEVGGEGELSYPNQGHASPVRQPVDPQVHKAAQPLPSHLPDCRLRDKPCQNERKTVN